MLSTASSQDAGEKLVRFQDVEQIKDAVLVSNVAVSGKPIECGLFVKPPSVVQPITPFAAPDDWLEHLTISLVNRTDKVIVFAAISLRFLDTGDCSPALPCVGTGLHLGQLPEIDSYSGRTGKRLEPERPARPPLNWIPQQTITVHVKEYLPEIVRDLSDSMLVRAVTKVNFSRSAVFFSDGMRWSLGRYSLPDSQHRGKFKELPIHYFPGRGGNNWPPGFDN